MPRRVAELGGSRLVWVQDLPLLIVLRPRLKWALQEDILSCEWAALAAYPQAVTASETNCLGGGISVSLCSKVNFLESALERLARA